MRISTQTGLSGFFPPHMISINCQFLSIFLPLTPSTHAALTAHHLQLKVCVYSLSPGAYCGIYDWGNRREGRSEAGKMKVEWKRWWILWTVGAVKWMFTRVWAFGGILLSIKILDTLALLEDSWNHHSEHCFFWAEWQEKCFLTVLPWAPPLLLHSKHVVFYINMCAFNAGNIFPDFGILIFDAYHDLGSRIWKGEAPKKFFRRLDKPHV